MIMDRNRMLHTNSLLIFELIIDYSALFLSIHTQMIPVSVAHVMSMSHNILSWSTYESSIYANFHLLYELLLWLEFFIIKKIHWMLWNFLIQIANENIIGKWKFMVVAAEIGREKSM